MLFDNKWVMHSRNVLILDFRIDIKKQVTAGASGKRKTRTREKLEKFFFVSLESARDATRCCDGSAAAVRERARACGGEAHRRGRARSKD